MSRYQSQSKQLLVTTSGAEIRATKRNGKETNKKPKGPHISFKDKKQTEGGLSNLIKSPPFISEKVK